jgi:hypothetical protein
VLEHNLRQIQRREEPDDRADKLHHGIDTFGTSHDFPSANGTVAPRGQSQRSLYTAKRLYRICR